MRVFSFLILLFLFLKTILLAHPTGGMLQFKEAVYWVYINPVDDTNHYACIMKWSDDKDVEVLRTSEFPASDFMLSSSDSMLYVIERRFKQSEMSFEWRLLTSTDGVHFKVKRDWELDQFRIGEGGFFLNEKQEMVYAKYPHVYKGIGSDQQLLFEFEKPIKSLKKVGKSLLIQSDSVIYQTTLEGEIIKSWSGFIDEKVKDAPLNRNSLFDVSLLDNQLFAAYWGAKTLITFENGKWNTVHRFSTNYVPHWLCEYKGGLMVMASAIKFDGSTPKPYLIYIKDKKVSAVWVR